jgi:lactonase
VRRAYAAGALLIAAPLAFAACTAEADPEPAASASSPSPQTAVELAKLTDPHEATGGTLLEGPTFADDGSLYVVDVMAPPGEAKVLRVDIADGSAEQVYTDDAGVFTSAQFGNDGRLYLTDMLGSAVRSIAAVGTDSHSVFEGEIDGSPMQPDDLAFGPDGSMYVSDTTGLGGTAGDIGRVIRITPDGDASVFAEGIPSPNGISFDENMAGLWVAEYNANRIDYFSLDADGGLAEMHEAIHIDGGRARVDSTAVDADGNIYQMFHNRTAVEVFDSEGAHLTTVEVPDDHDLSSATNIAIEPGTTNGVITVSGPDGGYLYSFDALAEGTRQSNGG